MHRDPRQEQLRAEQAGDQQARLPATISSPRTDGRIGAAAKARRRSHAKYAASGTMKKPWE